MKAHPDLFFSDHLSAVLLNRRWGWKAMVAGLAVHIMRVASIMD